MSNNSILPSGSGRRPRLEDLVDALMPLIRDRLPTGVLVSAHLIKQIGDLAKQHIFALLGSGFAAAGLAAILPSLAGVIVNELGFTAGGVLAGSIAASVQSAVYAGSTSGVFSALQSFGATAAVAPPVALALAGISLGIGAGFLGYWLDNRIEDGPSRSGNSPPCGGSPPLSRDDKDQSSSSTAITGAQVFLRAICVPLRA
ncbi:hypothetical protein BDZ97DRAFT_1925935 [Flammula alnicola]|nr:hypothetical protein BDZ97DRAFT_1925935 [Flammula alnicola]